MKNTAVKYLLILLAVSFILLIIISYLLYLKKSPPPAVALPLEGTIGTVVDVSIQPDGKVELIVDDKTYLLPSDQKVKLYTSNTESVSITIDQLKKGTIVNVLKFTNPDRYEILGVTDKALSGKLI